MLWKCATAAKKEYMDILKGADDGGAVSSSGFIHPLNPYVLFFKLLIVQNEVNMAWLTKYHQSENTEADSLAINYVENTYKLFDKQKRIM